MFGKSAVGPAPYRLLRAGVIITGAEIYSGRIKDMFETICRMKLAQYPGEIMGVEVCDDNLEMLVKAAHSLLDRGADFLIFSGGMSVDTDDLTPSAIRVLGCDVVSYGIPSQPGDMALMTYLHDKGKEAVPVIGVPGAALTMPTTVFDALLPQIYTGVPLTKEDWVRLGDGGLCQLCRPCHSPNCTFGKY